MKVRPMILAAASLMLLAVAIPAHAEAQVTGTWELAIDGPRGPQTMVLVLETEGSELTGTLTPQPPDGGGSARGGGGGRGGPDGGGPPELSLSDGSVDGDTFTFAVTMSMRGNSFTQEFSGTVEGDQMSGTISTPRGERPFTGKRAD